LSEFVDGGGADGGDHGDHGHAHEGGHHGSKHGSLAQLLGIDQDSEHAAHGHHGEAPQQTGIWNSALKGLNLKNLTSGIVITPNFLFILLFGAFTAWLGVIYWIRHNEPFANQVLGSGSAYAPTASYDRHLINGVREAMPVHTTGNMGLIYTPMPGQGQTQGLAQTQMPAAPMQQQMPPMAQGAGYMLNGPMPNGPMIIDPNMRSVRTFGLRGRNQANVAYQQSLQNGAMQGVMPPQPQAQLPAQPLPPAPTSWSLAAGGFSQETAQFNSQFGAPLGTGMLSSGQGGGQMAYRDHYYVPVHSEGGTRLKVFANR
jgi:hypothetical protein